MKKYLPIALLLLATKAGAFVNLSGAWVEDGGYKMAQQDSYPGGASSNTISQIWDGTTMHLYGAGNETVYAYLYLLGGASNATNVMVTISSFTGIGTAAGSGFASIAVSSSNVWNYTTRPYVLTLYKYLQIIGMNKNGPWDPTEYEERQVPTRWQVPCTVNGNNDCVPNGSAGSGTYTFLSRTDANKFYPDIAVPMEEFAISSFTVAASSSQAVGLEVYISTTLPAGQYTATMTVYEGATVSTSIPVNLTVYSYKFSDTPSIPILGYVDYPDLNIRLNGTRFPPSQFVAPYLTSLIRTAGFLHRHRITEIGDEPVSGTDYPSPDYLTHINGSAYTSTYGYGNGPGVGVGDKYYMVGAYGFWISSTWSTSTLTGTNGYCTNVSSWVAYGNANNLTLFQYTADDEGSSTTIAGRDNTFATWNSTVPACASGGNKLPYFQTQNLPIVAQAAPYIKAVASTNWIEASSSTWQTYETMFATTTGLYAGGYNSTVPQTDSLFALQEMGLGPVEVMVGAAKYSQKFWFLWSMNYWQDVNNGGQPQNGYNANTNNDNNIFNLAKDFGYDQYPSTDAVDGHTGFAFANMDGNMLYPGTDTVYQNPSYGFNGVIGSWRLNMLTRGSYMADLINYDMTINPTKTTTIVDNLVQNALWTNPCFTTSDCTYTYGPRPWTETENTWETSRVTLEQIAAGIANPSVQILNLKGSGFLNGTGTLE